MNLFRQIIGLLSFLFIAISPLKAEVIADSLKEALSVVKDEYHRIDIYLEINKSLKTTDIDSAIFYTERAREIALDEEDDKDVAESLFILGKMNLRRDSTYAARDDFDLALKYTDKCDCDSLEAAIYLFLGKVYTFHDNYEEAIVNFLKSQEIAEEIDNILILEDLLDDIGLVMAYLQDYDDAMNYFERALEINKVTTDKQNYATTLRNIGTIYQDKKQFVEAKQHFKEALDIYTALNYFPGMSTSNIGIGNTEFGMGNYSTALEYYQKSLQFATQIEISPKVYGPSVVALCYNRLGKTYLKLGRYKDAIEVLRISSDLSDEYDLPGRKAEASYFLSNVYEQTGNTILSFEYFKIYNQLSDSIINARNVSIITKLQMEYQYLKKHKERQLEEMMKEEAYKRKVLVYELMIAVSVIMLILLAMIFILYRKNQRGKAQKADLAQKNLELEKENLKTKLDFKNKELTTNVMYQLKKNNFIWSISEKLKELTIHLKPDNKKSIKDVIKELDSNMSKESWEEFEFRFNEVHNKFYESLIKDFPDLTPNELKLSAFLKLNMTTKDIGTITYQTTHSITVARHRLRAKLGLERDANLVSFLAKY
jgi:tetratricopeptide (TPR) repeat protein